MANQYKLKHSISEMINLAESRGGKCNSIIYKNNKEKLEWQCNFGHIWVAQPRAIIAGQWCPICSSGLGERICRLVFEELFNNKFIKCKPKWLIGSKGKLLELDGYCAELNFAFEYNGMQHYKSCTKFKTPDGFWKEKDLLKMNLCKKHGTKLFVIPQLNRYNKSIFDYILSCIKEQVINLDINYPINFDSSSIDYNKVYFNSKDFEALNKIKQIAINRGGECLSNEYFGSNEKLIFKCGNCNHVWKTTPRDINGGSWCHRCAGRAFTINDVIEFAKIKNGKCLSNEFIISKKKLIWECDKNHTWIASFSQVRRGTWCPTCSHSNAGKNKIIPIDVYKEVAKNKGGECLSNSVKDSNSKLEWKCSEGHIWFATASEVKNTSQWCPICARKSAWIKRRNKKEKNNV